MPPSVLVVGPAWVGDMMLAQSLFMSLRRRRSAPAIDVIAPAWSLPLLERMPEVREAIPLDVAHGELALVRRWRTGRNLRKRGYCQGIVLPRSAKAALPLLAAGIPRRTGYRGEFRYGLLNDIRPLDRAQHYRTVDRFVALASEPGDATPFECPAPRLTVDTDQLRATLEYVNLEPASKADPVLALCPGAEYGPAKQWPETHFATLARACLAASWRVWILGSPKDHATCTRIAAEAPGASNLAGRTTLNEAIDALSASTAVVSNDSGLMHIAAATGRPLVALYGSSDPGYTPPMSSVARILYLGLDCSPCFARECPLGHRNCLWGIEPDAALAALRELVADAALPEHTAASTP